MSAPGWLTRRPVAHRGLHDRAAGRIENSLSAVRAAIAGDYAIEVDLQLAADAVPMVFHDPTLDRLTERRGPLAGLAGAEIGRIPLRQSDDTIPSLDDLLATVGGAVPLVIELKPHGARTQALARATVDRVTAYDGPVALMSFDPDMVGLLAAIAPQLPRGIIADTTPAPTPYGGLTTIERFGLRHLLHIPRTRPQFIAYDCRALPAPGPWLWRLLRGLPILTWTVRSAAEQRRVGRWSDQIIFEDFEPGSGGAD